MTRRIIVPFIAVLVLLTGCSSTAEPIDPDPTPSSYAEYDAIFADWAPRYVDCAREHGADARLGDDGSIINAYAEGRPLKEGLDAECIEEVGPPPNAPPLTDAFLRGMYELFLMQAGCLRDHGYSVTEAPSRDQWVDNYDGESWNPLMDVHNAGRDVEEADRLCPQPDPREAERIGSNQ